MHCRSRMTRDPCIPTMPGQSASGFHRPGRHCLHQARSAVRCWVSRVGGGGLWRGEAELLIIAAGAANTCRRSRYLCGREPGVGGARSGAAGRSRTCRGPSRTVGLSRRRRTRRRAFTTLPWKGRRRTRWMLRQRLGFADAPVTHSRWYPPVFSWPSPAWPRHSATGPRGTFAFAR